MQRKTEHLFPNSILLNQFPTKGQVCMTTHRSITPTSTSLVTDSVSSGRNGAKKVNCRVGGQVVLESRRGTVLSKPARLPRPSTLLTSQPAVCMGVEQRWGRKGSLRLSRGHAHPHGVKFPPCHSGMPHPGRGPVSYTSILICFSTSQQAKVWSMELGKKRHISEPLPTLLTVKEEFFEAKSIQALSTGCSHQYKH